jgi:mRNA interferase RelE/StbE
VAYRVVVEGAAARTIRKLPRQTQRQVVAKAEGLGQNPRPPGCKKLEGAEDLYRVRVGEYRIVYRIEDRKLVVLVIRVAPRSEAYRRLGRRKR